MTDNKEIQIFQSADGDITLDVSLTQETVWLSQVQMSELFGTKRPAITKHLSNIYKSGELEELTTCSILEHMADHGQRYKTKHYNLDVVISVGYRVKSQRGVQFRQWATKLLKQHLVQGYTLNEKRLQERGIEFDQAVQLLAQTLENQQLVSTEGVAVLSVVSDYARSWSLLQAYDEQSLSAQTTKQIEMKALELSSVLTAIAELKQTLIAKGEVTKPWSMTIHWLLWLYWWQRASQNKKS